MVSSLRLTNPPPFSFLLFKAGKVNFLICTDVAARGIDIKGLPFLINVNLPEEKSNYVHRIGRVGRAERMGLAITLVATRPEKVWYHGQWCKSRGRGCYNTKLTDVKGCCTWNDDMKFLADIEEHLGVTIQQVGKDMTVDVDEFDGKVVYGKKREEKGELMSLNGWFHNFAILSAPLNFMWSHATSVLLAVCRNPASLFRDGRISISRVRAARKSGPTDRS